MQRKFIYIQKNCEVYSQSMKYYILWGILWKKLNDRNTFMQVYVRINKVFTVVVSACGIMSLHFFI